MKRGRGRVDYRNMAKLRRPRPLPGLSEHGFSYFIIDFSSLICIMIFIVETGLESRGDSMCKLASRPAEERRKRQLAPKGTVRFEKPTGAKPRRRVLSITL